VTRFRWDDILRIKVRLEQGALPKLKRLLLPGNRRAAAAWSAAESAPRHWGAVPAIRRNWNERISGHPERDWMDVALSHGAIPANARILSIACGNGANEVAWLGRCRAAGIPVAHMTAFDVSASRIAAARNRAAEAGFADETTFLEDGFDTFNADAGAFDVIIAENALHHAQNLDVLLDRMKVWLRPGGSLIVRDFVGPSRFQWTNEQVGHADRLLTEMPERLRRRHGSGAVKTRFLRTGTWLMHLSDPSEAAHSSEILDGLRGRFREELLVGMGGTVLQLVFEDIAGNFLDPDDAEAMEHLHRAIETENALIRDGVLPDDFVFGIFRL